MATLARKEAAKDPLSLSSVLANLGSKDDDEDNRPVPGEFKIPQIPKPIQVTSFLDFKKKIIIIYTKRKHNTLSHILIA